MLVLGLRVRRGWVLSKCIDSDVKFQFSANLGYDSFVQAESGQAPTTPVESRVCRVLYDTCKYHSRSEHHLDGRINEPISVSYAASYICAASSLPPLRQGPEISSSIIGIASFSSPSDIIGTTYTCTNRSLLQFILLVSHIETNHHGR